MEKWIRLQDKGLVEMVEIISVTDRDIHGGSNGTENDSFAYSFYKLLHFLLKTVTFCSRGNFIASFFLCTIDHVAYHSEWQNEFHTSLSRSSFGLSLEPPIPACSRRKPHMKRQCDSWS
jgi:hypothetical protein